MAYPHRSGYCSHLVIALSFLRRGAWLGLGLVLTRIRRQTTEEAAQTEVSEWELRERDEKTEEKWQESEEQG